MPPPVIRTGRLAVLFDAENVSAGKAGAVLASVADHGEVGIKRAYGDWSRPHLVSWSLTARAYGIRAVHAPAMSPGKNTADLALVAEAIQLAYTADLSGVVIVSSDSDFTDLALRLREAGHVVFGYGERRTLPPFVAACDQFVFLDNLTSPESGPAKPATAPARRTASNPALDSSKKPSPQNDGNGLPVHAADRLRALVDATASADGWANLATVCSRLHAESPNLHLLPADKRNKPGRYLKTCGLFDVANRSPGDGKPKVTFLRNKSSNKSSSGVSPVGQK
ncbi:NYN domain-containing protein [Nocardia sp. BMG51109]|uniref:NYN domain-containing protein n=1 Tax=Nocardia sp. BMG51109 TaxID=1056816 RepID=UPI000467334E|nr:NYN domain-containing protein [Nocardia sp. BMG51109]